MYKNKVKAKLLADEKVFGCLLRFPSLPIVEMVGILGFDYIFLDGEHGTFTLSDIEQMCIVADGMGLTILARVPNIHHSTILRFLDRGVHGIIGPHISTKTDAEALVKACKFPPRGVRSYAGGRTYHYAAPGNDLVSVAKQANAEILNIALLEDTQGLENLPYILEVEGLDVISFGPYDLSFSLGIPGNLEHQQMIDAVEKAAAQTRAAGKIFGPDLMTHVTMSDLIMSGGREFLNRARSKC